MKAADMEKPPEGAGFKWVDIVSSRNIDAYQTEITLTCGHKSYLNGQKIDSRN